MSGASWTVIGGCCYPPLAIASTGISAKPLTVYVALSGEDRVSRLALDPDDGVLRPAGSYALAGGPAPMAFDPHQRFVYVSRRTDECVSTLTVEPDGSLTPAGEVATPSGACYVSTDRTGRFLLTAYYADGAVAVHAIGDDGVAAGPPLCRIDIGTGAHILETDRTNRWAFSCTIASPGGSNAVHQFLFDERTGTLWPNTPPRLTGENGCGPRHFCFHPRLPLMYVSNEQGGSVTAYRLDTGNGTLTRWHTVSTLPSGYDGENTCSQIRITPDGANLFAPNRGHDSIANFALDAETGALALREIVPTEPVPRACQLDPAGRLLLAAGQESGRIAAYRIGPADGRLTPLEVSEVGESPVWILFRSDKEMQA
ncbi:MAG: lactonase family protein [Spirochaetaceae bacterium]|nr:lactonase family protein [Spirochaetaceae bacterium]